MSILISQHPAEDKQQKIPHPDEYSYILYHWLYEPFWSTTTHAYLIFFLHYSPLQAKGKKYRTKISGPSFLCAKDKQTTQVQLF